MKIRRWTTEEVEILKDKYAKYGAIYLEEELNRHRRGIINKASKLGLKYEKIRERYLEENFRPVIETSKSLTECLDKMKLRSAGGNYEILNKYIEKYNISTEHFNPYLSSNTEKAIKNNTLTLDEVLIENSSYDRGSLKKRILKEKLIEYKCSKCKNKGEWNGEKLSLQLDHINGINNDNRLENLRFLCPNCHSQTDTFSGKNK